MERPTTPVGLKDAWKEYPSIDNASGRVIKKVNPKDAEGRWVALEKVHGSNFCFISNGTDLLAARRNALLDPVETFYSWQRVRDKYATAFHELYHLVRDLPDHSDVTEVCVFGELFGGVYPHPEVQDLGLQPVQKGVYYTPDLDFYAFDIQLVRPGGAEAGQVVVKSWLDFDRALELFAACGLFHARPLVEGTLAECFAFDIRVNSTVPALLGLPPLPRGQNQMEGVVIKSVHNLALPMGKQRPAGAGAGPRAIFKKKNAKFEEVNPKCESRWEEQRRVKKAAVDTVYEEVERYITVNRLHNLESKMGPVTRDNAGEAAAALAADAMKDLIGDYEETWAVIEEGVREVVHKNVRSKAAQWLNDHLNNNDNDNSNASST